MLPLFVQSTAGKVHTRSDGGEVEIAVNWGLQSGSNVAERGRLPYKHVKKFLYSIAARVAIAGGGHNPEQIGTLNFIELGL
jgi:hypothetical protein